MTELQQLIKYVKESEASDLQKWTIIGMLIALTSTEGE